MNFGIFIWESRDKMTFGSKPFGAQTSPFLYECILTKFGCPLTIVTFQGVHFINDAIKYLIDNFLMKHVSSTSYYP